jgi:hypothetical protein
VVKWAQVMEGRKALILSNTTGWGNGVVKRVSSIYNVEVFIVNQVSGNALISTIMPLVIYIIPRIFLP